MSPKEADTDAYPIDNGICVQSLRQAKDGVIIEVKARPNSSQTRLYSKNREFVLDLQNKPEGNKANMEAVKYLSQLFGKEVKLIRGLKSKRKVFLVKTSMEDVRKVMNGI